MDSLGGPFDQDFDSLQIRKELPGGFPDDFRPGAAFPANHTASFILPSGNRAFSAYLAYFRHNRCL